MADRYSVVHRPRVELTAIEFGVPRPGAPIEQYCFQVEDSMADGDYIGGPYSTKAEAQAACDQLNSGERMLNLTDGNREYLKEMRALSTDLKGREIYVGLTREESERYHALSDPLRSGTYEEKEEYIALDDKHNFARMQVLGAEHIKRTENPSQH